MWTDGTIKIIIIEDCIESVLDLRNMLMDENFDVFSSCSEQGIRLCMHEEPNLILLNFHPDNRTGIEILKKLKCNSRTQHIPVVILSDSDSLKNWDSLYKPGSGAYHIKPINYPFLHQKIKNILYRQAECSPFKTKSVILV